jgi:hypothetical protein
MNNEDLVPDDFLHLPAEEQASIIQTCAAKLGRRPEHLEKDVWICWVLQNLFGLPQRLPMAFKGGTSLSKVFDAIRRFSEDVDITINYRALDDTIDPFAPGLSQTQQKIFSETLRARLIAHTHNVILPYFEDLLAPIAKRKKLVELSEDGESMRIYYPSVHSHGETVLADHDIGKISVPNRALLADVVKHKKAFFYTGHANYDACLAGELQLAPEGALLDALSADFGQMVKNGMFDVEPPGFDKIVLRLKALEREINGGDR